jgi:hypothetical protein
MAKSKYPEYSHDPNAVRDYPFNWGPFLAEVNDIIDTATVAPADPDDDGIIVGVITNDDTFVYPWISCGTVVVGERHLVTCHMISRDGREEDQTISLLIENH